MARLPGKYIVIEGMDGTGKTTQADLLQQYLQAQGIDAIHIKEPGGSPVAEAIRSVILDSTLPRTPMTNTLLFTANRHELWHAKMKPALDAGTWVICTRNYWSTIAYQGYGEGMDIPIIEAITATFTDSRYIHPDYAVILTIDDVHTAQRRVAARGELATPDTFESKDSAFLHRVQHAYGQIAADYNLPLISAASSIDTVASTIRQHLQLPT